MDFDGTYHLNATPTEVWQALNSEDILARCIPGCDCVEKQEDGRFAASVVLRIGPIKARFHGTVRIEEISPLQQYLLEGEGKGGVAGFARGEARLDLLCEGDGTRLTYHVQARIGGKIAQLGSRMLQSTVQKLSDTFFQNLTAALDQTTADIALEAKT
ncbi:CoxG family protein [Salipiger abyssi]|uniref:CoxG family protein n=1 Tax=Salipiger abyssi TaxID=1250539 RepID=UPI001A8EE6F1|nr:carbon monoxide dehydrogenase subunit G [Salipiger abyssi]MBN9887997.1 carbon monoxide dehydrogenase subunit G [Salipiger abyssi]